MTDIDDLIADYEAWDHCYPGNMDIESWADRAAVALREQRDEIALLKRAEELYTENASIVTLAWEKRAQKAEAERDTLRSLAQWLRSQTSCENYHHDKHEYHKDWKCPVEERIDAALARLEQEDGR